MFDCVDLDQTIWSCIGLDQALLGHIGPHDGFGLSVDWVGPCLDRLGSAEWIGL